MNKNMVFWLLVILVLALLLVCWNAVLAADGLPVQSPAPTPGATVGPPPLPQPPTWVAASRLALPIIRKQED